MTPEDEAALEAYITLESNTDPEKEYQALPPLVKDLISELDDVGSAGDDSDGTTSSGCVVLLATTIPTAAFFAWSAYECYNNFCNG